MATPTRRPAHAQSGTAMYYDWQGRPVYPQSKQRAPVSGSRRGGTTQTASQSSSSPRRRSQRRRFRSKSQGPPTTHSEARPVVVEVTDDPALAEATWLNILRAQETAPTSAPATKTTTPTSKRGSRRPSPGSVLDADTHLDAQQPYERSVIDEVLRSEAWPAKPTQAAAESAHLAPNGANEATAVPVTPEGRSGQRLHAALREKIRAQDAIIEDLQQRCDAHQEREEQQRGEQQSREAELLRVCRDVQGAAESNLEGAETKAAHLEAQLAAYEDQIRSMSRHHDKQLRDLQQNNRQTLEHMQEHLSIAKHEALSFQTEAARLQEQLREVASMSDSHEQRWRAAEAGLERERTELRTKSESMDALLLKLDSKTQKLQDVERLRSEGENAHRMQLQQLQAESDRAKQELAHAEALVQQLKAKLNESEEHRQQLGDELKAERQRSEESARMVTRLRSDMDQLQKELDEVRDFYETTDERTRCRHLITEWEKRDLRKQIRTIKSQKNAPALLKRLSLKYHPDKNVAGLQWLFSALQIEINSAAMAMGDER